MRSTLRFCFACAIVLLSTVALSSCNKDSSARRAETSIDVGAGPDFFQAIDGGIKLSEAEIKGRNAWHLWSAGNDAFWDEVAGRTGGMVDLLRMLDSRRRGSRFAEMGLINEPGFRAATKQDEFGLWLDERETPESSPIDPKLYGRSSGVLGFRLFPNPKFQGKARDCWNAELFYNDPKYAANPALVRPYRIGVACAACHVGPHPLHPPADPENPEWKNLASVIGNQYLHEGRVFAAGARKGTFFREMLNAQPRGTSDTSRLATDNINNPSAINSIFLLKERL